MQPSYLAGPSLLHGTRLVTSIAGCIHTGTSSCVVAWKHLLRRSYSRAADPRGAGAARAVLARRRAHWSHGRGAQLSAGQPGREGWFEGGHHLRGGAVAPAHGRIRVTDHNGMQRTTGLGAHRVLHGFQGVQNHVRGLFDSVLSLQLTQLVEGCCHGLLYVLSEGGQKCTRHNIQGKASESQRIMLSVLALAFLLTTAKCREMVLKCI